MTLAPLVASVDPLADSPSPAPTAVAQDIEPVIPTPALTVSVLTPRGRIASGEDVTLTLLVDAPALVRDLTISLTLPEGLEAVGQRSHSGPVVFGGLDIARRGAIQVLIRAASVVPVSLRLRVEASAPGLAPEAIRAVGGKLAIYGHRVAQRVSAAGGRAAFGERIALAFAPNALARDADIAISTGPANAEPEDEFDPILAFEASPGQAFRAPVTVTLALSGLLGGRAGYGAEPVLRYWRVSEDGQSWAAERIPASFDPSTAELIARLEHFSQYDVVLQTPQDPKPWQMVSNPSTALRAGLGGVNAFRGTTSIAVPIDVPPMQDGLEPKLALQYSSGGAERQFDTPGGAGMGWSLETPVVRQRVSIYQWDWGESCGQGCWRTFFGTALSDANDYSLSFGGQEYSLVHVGGGEFVTERYAPLRIWYCASQTTCLAPQAPGARALSSDAFWVWTENGTLYVFGGDGESTSRIWANRENAYDSDVIAWHLRHVYATHRDDPSQTGRWSAKYNYWAMSNAGVDYRLLTSVAYGNGLGATARNTVTIDYVMRPLPMPMRYQPLTITVKAGQTSDPVWWYGLDYGYFPDRYVLTRVTKIAADGAQMPATTFDYTSVCIDGANPCKTATLMTRVSNGYGGSVAYAFGPGPSANAAERKVLTETTSDGTTNVAVRTFQYAQPCKNENNAVCRTYHDFGPSGYLMGYGVVTETARDGAGAALRITGHRYYTDAVRLGMEASSVTVDPAGAALTAQTTEWDALGCDAGWPDGSWLVTALTSTRYLAGDASSGLFRRTASQTGLTRTNCARIYEYSTRGQYGESLWYDKSSWTDRLPSLLLWQRPPIDIVSRYQILRDSAPGTVPLYLCGFEWVKGEAGDKSAHTFLSRQADCSRPGGSYWGNEATAFRYGVGFAGYIYSTTNGIYSQALASCQKTGDGYHSIAEGTTCPAGTTLMEVLGYASPDTPTAVLAADIALKAQAAETAESDPSGVVRRSASASAVLSTTTRWAVVGISQTVRDGAGSLLDETRAFYDDLPTFGAVAKGDLTFVQKRAEGNASIDRKLSYDANGALESETVYADYGTLGVMTNTSGVLRRTSNVFDAGAGMYVTQQRVYGADTTPQTRTVSYAYYGVGGQSVTNTLGARQPVGALKAVTDVNQAVTVYAYDLFGRLRKVARPGDTLADPSEEWRYFDGVETSRTMTASGFSQGPFVTDHRLRGVAGGGWTSSTLASLDRTIYDGLGRVIQTQTRAGQGWQLADCADYPRKTLGAEIIQSTLYDALGRPTIQTVPYTQTQYESCGSPGWINTPFVPMPLVQTPPSETDLAAVFFNGMSFETPVLTRTDATVDFNWGGSPGSGVSSDYFSARWRGTLQATTSENYTLYATGDDGIRLWINGQLLVDQWHNQGPTEYSAQVALQAGVYNDLVFEYYENDGGAVAKLKWASPTISKQVIPAANLYGVRPSEPLTPAMPYARTAYDALGRAVAEIAPDGTQTRHWYVTDTATQYGYTPTNLLLHSVVDANNQSKHYVSDAIGRQVKVRELERTVGGTYTLLSEMGYAYDAADRLTIVTDTVGNVTAITYDALGRKVGMSDPDMGIWSYAYNALGQLSSQTDAKGQTMVFAYDALGRMTAKTARDPEPMVLEAEGPMAQAQCGTIITSTSATSRVGFCNGALAYGPYLAPRYAGPGQTAVFRLAMTSTQNPGDATIVATIDVFDYTANQALAWRDLKRGDLGGGIDHYREFALSFDTTGREDHQLEYRVWLKNNETIAHDRTTILWQQPLGQYLYDQGDNGIGRRSRMTDTTGSAWWAYDTRGRVTDDNRRVQPANFTYLTRYGYDDANRVTTMWMPGGEVVTNTYDSAGQPYSLTAGGSAIVTGAAYNALGAPTRVSFGNGLDKVNRYFGLDFQAGSGFGPLFAYGKLRNTCVITASLGCVESETNALFNTAYWFDKVGNVSTVRDNVLNEKQMPVYDALDRLTSISATAVVTTLPATLLISETYAYDKIGNMTAKAGVSITYGSGNGGVLKRLGFEGTSVYSLAEPGASFQVFQTYGAWSFEGSAGVSYTGTYLTGDNPPTPEGAQVAFLQGVARMTTTVTGFTVGQSYRVGFKMAQRTGFGRPQTVVVRAGGTALGAFAAPTGAWEQEWTEAFTATASSLTIAFWTAPGDGYDRMGFIDDFMVKTAGPHAAVGMSNGNRYAYDANGNMTLRTELSGTETFVYTQTWTADNRLQTVIKTDITGTVLAVTQYAYDGDGVRVRKSDPSGTTLYIGLTEVTLAYTPPTVKGNTGVSADGFDLRKRGATVGWDAGVFDGQHAITQTGFAQVRVETKYSGYRLFGLTTNDIGGGFCPARYGLELVHGGTLEVYENCARVAHNQAALVYGAGDQLRIEADAGVVRYKRQVAGAGNWQVLYTSTLPVTAAVYFNASLYTPGSTLKDIRFVIGSTGAPSVNRTYYTFGGARVAMRDGAGAPLVYLHGDHLGSASLVTSMTGTVLSQQRYAPYGEVRWASGSMPTDFTFTSQRAGPANYVGSLTDYVARYYSPALGRFISADTIVPGAGRPQAFNRYAYALGNPIGLVDPSGHASIPPWWSWQLGGDEGAFTELEHLEMALLVSIRGTLLSDRQNPKDPDCRTCVLAGGNLLHAIVQLDALGRLGARTLEAPVVGAGPSGVECGCADIVLPDGSFYEVKARASYFRDADATRAQVSLMTDRPYDGMILGPGAKPDAKSWDIDLTGFGAGGRQLHVEWMAPGVLVYDLRGARRDIPDLTPIGIFEAFRKWLVERQKRPDRLPPIVPQPGPVPAPSWSPQQLQMP